MRDHLVFVRAGRNSLHRDLLDADPQRNWDCCVNAWSGASEADALDASRGNIEIFQDGSINKFEAFATYAAQTGHARRYRQVLMLDDDLRFEPGAVSRYFRLCETENLFLSQPAIAWGSHANHVVNLWNPITTVRRVNFVEVMAPCFSREALAELMAPTFSLTRCTWGIDYAWSSLLQGRGCQSIVDAVPMAHTKPMSRDGGPFYETLRAAGIEPEDELAAVHATFPRWGEMATLATGHRCHGPMPPAATDVLVAWIETHKLQAHLQAGGTLAPQLAVGERYVAH